MIGQTINGYRITEEIGKGGMATVYKGVKPGFAKAFKVVRPDKAENNTALHSRFLKEIEFLRKLGEHPNIVRGENVHVHNNTTVLEMEYLEGLDFENYIKKQAPSGIQSKEQLKKIAVMILEVLDFAHKNNILHLDIKPNNIFRTKSGFIKLLDFGIAKVVGEKAEIIQGAENVTMTSTETGESTFRGAIAYSSPEQQAGTVLGVTSDIFSFGKTLHYIATGSNDMSIECTVAPFDAVIEKCTQQNRNKRFQTCKDIIDFVNSSATKPCINKPKCGKPIPADSGFCPHCGTPQKEQLPPPPPPLKCPKCGITNSKNNRFCYKCGYDFEKREPKGKKCPKGCPEKQGCNYSKDDNYCYYCRSVLVEK